LLCGADCTDKAQVHSGKSQRFQHLGACLESRTRLPGCSAATIVDTNKKAGIEFACPFHLGACLESRTRLPGCSAATIVDTNKKAGIEFACPFHLGKNQRFVPAFNVQSHR